MITFCDALHETKHYKLKKNTLESAQCGLEIIFKRTKVFSLSFWLGEEGVGIAQDYL